MPTQPPGKAALPVCVWVEGQGKVGGSIGECAGKSFLVIQDSVENSAVMHSLVMSARGTLCRGQP